MKDYLPIGSVVELKNSRVIMIIGYYSVEYHDNDIDVYDYSGCAYPEGIMLKSNCLSFNNRDISKVLFEGYKTKEYESINKKFMELNSIDIPEEKEELKEEKKDNLVSIFDDVEPLEEVKIDKIEESKKSDSEMVIIPHYEFDDDGIIIEN